MKSLDKKLKTIAAGKYKPQDFILADAKDPDYAFGVKGTGAHDYLDQSGKHRSIPEFRQTIRDIVKQKQMDVMLGAVSNMELLIEEGLFDEVRRHPGDPRQRHHRHLAPARWQLCQGAVAPVAHRQPRPCREVLRPRPLFGDLQQHPRARPRDGQRNTASSATTR